jgi:hypothetical protein
MKVTIIGGGTAGWLTGLFFNKKVQTMMVHPLSWHQGLDNRFFRLIVGEHH